MTQQKRDEAANGAVNVNSLYFFNVIFGMFFLIASSEKRPK